VGITIHVVRSPQGDPLDAEALATLRALLAEQSARRLTVPLGVSVTALIRAAAGMRVLAGTRALIRAGLEMVRAAGELPELIPPRKGGRP
jgi:hypothetical protein